LHSNVAKDINGNASLGLSAKFADSHNCVVNAPGMKSVVVVGVDDCIIAENDGNLLVCRMSDENRIKEFSEEN
jgi:mannose-1-phosphate guanylyltransferase